MSNDTQEFHNGEWRPSCPLPFYVRSWRTLFRWRYRCECGGEFNSEAAYRFHWRRFHTRVSK